MTFQVIKTGVKFKGTISRNGSFLYLGEEAFKIYFICATTHCIEVEHIGFIKQVKTA